VKFFPEIFTLGGGRLTEFLRLKSIYDEDVTKFPFSTTAPGGVMPLPGLLLGCGASNFGPNLYYLSSS